MIHESRLTEVESSEDFISDHGSLSRQVSTPEDRSIIPAAVLHPMKFTPNRSNGSVLSRMQGPQDAVYLFVEE